MPKVTFTISMRDGDGFYAILRVAGQTYRVERSTGFTLDLDTRIYSLGIAGIQDPSDTDSTIVLKAVSESGRELGNYVIAERQFIKSFRLAVA